MKFITTWLLSFVFLQTSCSNSFSQSNVGDRLLENPQHHIKDNTEKIKHDSNFLYTGWYYVIDTDNGYKRQLDKSIDTFFIDTHPIVTATHFTTLEIYESNAGGTKYNGLTILLDKKGTESWSVATENSIGKQLAFVLDNRLLYVAKVNDKITYGVTALNRGNYSKTELEDFKKTIESER